ncbi:hypothetical protein ABZ642_14600 [Streptomyces sp. NPDC007157]
MVEQRWSIRVPRVVSGTDTPDHDVVDKADQALDLPLMDKK